MGARLNWDSSLMDPSEMKIGDHLQWILADIFHRHGGKIVQLASRMIVELY